MTQIEETDDTQGEITQTIRLMNFEHVEELTEKNYAEWESSLKYEIALSCMEWALDAYIHSPSHYSQRQHQRIIATVRGIIRKSIPVDMRMDLNIHRLTK